MAGIGICKNNECINKDNCERFTTKDGEPLEFKNICNEQNNYQWIMQLNKDLEVKK